LVFASATAVCLFILYFNPFPLWREWDFYFTHNPFAWYIIDYNTIFRTAAYIESFSILLAISSYTFNADTSTVGWMLAHFLFPLIFIYGLYYFLHSFKTIKNEKWIILISLSTLLIFSTKEIGTPFISAPKTIIFLLIPFVFGFLNRNVLVIVVFVTFIFLTNIFLFRLVERVRNNFSKEIRKQKLKRIVEELVNRRKK